MVLKLFNGNLKNDIDSNEISDANPITEVDRHLTLQKAKLEVQKYLDLDIGKDLGVEELTEYLYNPMKFHHKYKELFPHVFIVAKKLFAKLLSSTASERPFATIKIMSSDRKTNIKVETLDQKIAIGSILRLKRKKSKAILSRKKQKLC